MNPVAGIALIALGSIGAASFYVPFKKVRNWAWESYWIVQGLVAWILAPWVAAWLIGPGRHIGIYPFFISILCKTLGCLLWNPLGSWQPYLWTEHTVSWRGIGTKHCTGIVCSLWHPASSHHCGREPVQHTGRDTDGYWCIGVRAGHCDHRIRRGIEKQRTER